MNTDDFEGHTPGPWAYCEDEVYAEGNAIIVALRTMTHGCLHCNGPTELTSKLPHRWADFALIAAAPDLLEAVSQYKEKDAWYVAEVKRLQKRNEWLEEVVALAQEHGAIDLSDYGWPQWEEEE